MVLKRFVNEVAGCYISGSWYLNKCARLILSHLGTYTLSYQSTRHLTLKLLHKYIKICLVSFLIDCTYTLISDHDEYKILAQKF